VSTWAARRFWTAAAALPVEGGFTVQLDARPVRTPLKAPLVVPTLALAQAIAAEWQAQEQTIDPETMPFTRAANSAIDKVAAQFEAVVDMLAEYGGSDLLCYRAEGPADLVALQARSWDALLDWAREDLGAPLRKTTGVMHVSQPEASLEALRRHVHALTPFQLAAFHDIVAISGSLVLALAVARHRITADAAWTLSRIDEDWQISLWGEDEEAAEVAGRKREALLQAYRFYALCG
jgi:chaperone required for assembly of F1-ATPase